MPSPTSVGSAGGDGRHVLTSLEVAVALAPRRCEHEAGPDGLVVDLADAEAALGAAAVRYGRDDHYDVISAFIKSIRGSDPDAARCTGWRGCWRPARMPVSSPDVW